MLYADSNPNNDKSSAPVLIQSTCGSLNGPGVCGPGFVYIGPDDRTLSDPTDFVGQCCVSSCDDSSAESLMLPALGTAAGELHALAAVSLV